MFNIYQSFVQGGHTLSAYLLHMKLNVKVKQ